MKLITLAATAATTVSARRVNTPAPGFINEQGGYWADQSSDQSVQRPQQGQPPQIQPPHSTQAPQPDNRQCCRDIKWTQFSGDITWLKHNGQMYDAMPVYEMTYNDEQQFMWWNPVGAPDNRPQKAVPGYWVISTEVGSTTTGISGDEGYRNCPDASSFSGNEDGKNTFECANPPPTIESCDDYNLRQTDFTRGVFLQKGNNGICRVSPLMRDLVGNQFQQFLQTQNPSTYGMFHQAFNGMILGWEQLAVGEGRGQCGFRQSISPIVDEYEHFGVVNNCFTPCLALKEIKKPSDFSSILGIYTLIVKDSFHKIHGENFKILNRTGCVIPWSSKNFRRNYH